VIGQPISINNVTFTVVGVMPRSLNELVSARLMPGSEIWSPLGYTLAYPPACRSCRHIQMIGRIKDDVTIAQAQADASRVYQSLAQEFPRDYAAPTALLTPVRDRFLGPARPALMLLWGAVSLLLLMACANIANLLLIRASEREEEIAIRRALGVSPARLMRQLITESLLLAVAGGAGGTLLAMWAMQVLVANGPDEIPRLQEVTVSGTVLLYAIASSLVTGLIFGMAPARMLITRIGGGGAAILLTHATRTTAGPAAWRHRAWLIGVNVALSTVLLVASGLLVRSFVTLLSVDPGFRPAGVLTMQVELTGAAYDDLQKVSNVYRDLMARLRGLPGVVSVGASTQLPLTGSIDQWGITIEGRPLANPAESPEADRYGIEGDYFAAMHIPLLRGRVITDLDVPGTLPVVVIGRTAAERLFPGEDPIGRRIQLAGGPNNPFRTIVGVVGDVHHYGFHVPPAYQAYMPQSQSPWMQSNMTMIVRVAAGQDPTSLAAAVREQLRAIDPQQPIIRIETYDAIIATLMATRRFTLVLLAVFAGSALLLAVIGLYGALSYVVTQRRRELSVRVALGAEQRDIRRLVIAQGLKPVAAGLMIGLAAAAGGGQLINAMLFGVTPIDAVTYSAVLAAMIASAFVACVLPARRATRVEPAAMLRA
jgi:putative ABC transport system permease protein